MYSLIQFTSTLWKIIAPMFIRHTGLKFSLLKTFLSAFDIRVFLACNMNLKVLFLCRFRENFRMFGISSSFKCLMEFTSDNICSGFCFVGRIWFLIQSLYLLFACLDFKFLYDWILKSMFIGLIHFFWVVQLLAYLCSAYLWYIHGISCNISAYIYNFIYLCNL